MANTEPSFSELLLSMGVTKTMVPDIASIGRVAGVFDKLGKSMKDAGYSSTASEIQAKREAAMKAMNVNEKMGDRLDTRGLAIRRSTDGRGVEHVARIGQTLLAQLTDEVVKKTPACAGCKDLKIDAKHEPDPHTYKTIVMASARCKYTHCAKVAAPTFEPLVMAAGNGSAYTGTPLMDLNRYYVPPPPPPPRDQPQTSMADAW